jgi:hypothetical protein
MRFEYHKGNVSANDDDPAYPASRQSPDGTWGMRRATRSWSHVIVPLWGPELVPCRTACRSQPERERQLHRHRLRGRNGTTGYALGDRARLPPLSLAHSSPRYERKQTPLAYQVELDQPAAADTCSACQSAMDLGPYSHPYVTLRSALRYTTLTYL